MALLAGLLVEYLVIGAIASMWLGPFLAGAIASHPTLAKDLAPVLVATSIPAIYLAGMVCDWLGYWLLHSRKKKIEAEAHSDSGFKDIGSQTIHAFAVAYEPKLADEMNSRSARDRVARGAFAASIPLLVFSPLGYQHWWVGILSGVLILFFLYKLWARMQKLSIKYELHVLMVLFVKYPKLRRVSALCGKVTPNE